VASSGPGVARGVVRGSACESMAKLGRHTLAMITILAITGTLSACGRYGSPVRVVPVDVGAEAEIGVVDPQPKDLAADERSDRQDEDEDDRTE
jgi:hypothetical protein